MTKDAAQLSSEIKRLIAKIANWKNVDPASISDDAPLLQAGLGLDSIDVLELVVNLEKNYGIKLRNDENGQKALQSIKTLAEATHEFLVTSLLPSTSIVHAVSP